MASNLKPTFGYTVVYVKDVAKSVDFYAKAFGYDVRRLDESHRYVRIHHSKYLHVIFGRAHGLAHLVFQWWFFGDN